MDNFFVFSDVFYEHLNKNTFVEHCIIKNYRFDEEVKQGFCDVELPKSSQKQLIKNVPCYLPYQKTTWQDYTSGLLLKIKHLNLSCADVQAQKPISNLGYESPLTNAVIAIVLPIEEVLGNTLTQEFMAQNQILLKTTGDLDANAEPKSALEITCQDDNATASLKAGKNVITLDSSADTISIESKADMTIKSENAIEFGTSGGQLLEVLDEILDAIKDVATSQTEPCVNGKPTSLIAGVTAPATLEQIKQKLSKILK